jgi:Glycosyltransferase
MKKVKVLQFPLMNNKGGVTQYILNNWKKINKELFQFDFITFSKVLDCRNELEKQGCKVYYLSCYPEENLTQFIMEMDSILLQGYDVLHLHTSYWKSFIMEELAIKHNIPKIIVHAHSTMVLENKKEKREEAINLHILKRNQFTSDLATDFWTCSRLAADWLFGKQISQNKIVVMKNAINVDKFVFNCEIRARIRLKLEIEGNFVLGNVGRFAYEKNHKFLINIFKKIKEKVINTKLMLIGVGHLEDSIHKQVRELGLQDDVLFLKKREDVNDLMQGMDVFCLPSIFEGLPITLVEAQCSGLKCFASKNITAEVLLTDNIKAIPLEEDIWVSEILQYISGYRREAMDIQITNAGYNINYQIRELERLYSDTNV